MIQIKAFGGHLVETRCAAEVSAPSYDALSPAERTRFAGCHPQNYINTMRSPDEFPGCDEAKRRELLDSNGAKVKELLAAGKFRPNPKPCFFIYRLREGGHVQTGLVAQLPVSLYEQGRIKVHENTTGDREDQLLRYLEVVGAVSNPICLAYAGNPQIDEYIAQLSDAPPVLDFESVDHLHQTVWRVDDERACGELQRLFAGVSSAYLTDGHHRCTACLRHTRTQPEPGDHHYLLVGLFPENQLRIMPYHRCVRDLHGMDSAAFLARLAQDFTLSPLQDGDDPTPRRQGEFSLLLDGNWRRMRCKSAADANDPVAHLDVSVLENRLLGPVLGITDTRNDDRLGYIPGVGGVSGVEKRCREGWAAGIACYPTSLRQMMEAADAGCVMPPKSTWFDPKLRAGIFLIMYNH